MRVVVAPDSAGGTLDPVEMATSMAEGWRRARPDDALVQVPLSDGGEGLLAVVAGGVGQSATTHEADVAGPLGLATTARWLLLDDGTAVVESAEACGLRRVPVDQRDPRRATTWGVGQLLEIARRAGARRVVVGLGGSATVDGGTGALGGLGCRLTVADGSGLKVGGEDLPRVRGAHRAWLGDWDDVEVVLLHDVATVFGDAATVFGPQKGADEPSVAHLARGLRAWREVAEGDLGADPALAQRPGTGAAGGLGYGVAAALGDRVRWLPGAEAVGDLVGLHEALAEADLVVTGEGRLDATTARGKVAHHVAGLARDAGVPLALVVGQLATGVDAATVGAVDVEEAAPDGPGDDPAAEVAAAATRLAARLRTARG